MCGGVCMEVCVPVYMDVVGIKRKGLPAGVRRCFEAPKTWVL